MGTPIPEDPEILDQSDSTNQKLPAKSANKVVKKQQDELNDYLAYQGVKSLKAMELERLKAKEELAKCTFRPQVINYKNTSSKGNLEKREVDRAIYEEVKSDMEMKACTFKPSLTKKSKKIIAKYSKEPAKSYEILHQKHQLQQEKARKMMQERQAKELSECTFAPKVKKKATTRPKAKHLGENLVQMPERINTMPGSEKKLD